MKLGPIGRVVALVCAVLLVAGAITYLEHLPPGRLAALFGVTVTVSDLHTPTPSPTPSVIPLGDRVPGFSLGTVAVQTFDGAHLVHTAAATVVTSDGLLVTTSVAAPYGSGSFIYQIATAQGSVVRARRVAYDAATGLVLMKADGVDVPTVEFSDGQFRAGDTLSIVGATFGLSHYVPVVLEASVVYAADDEHPVFSLDRSYLPLLSGARVLDGSGRTVGMLSPVGAGFIPATDINAVIDRYLAQNH